MSLDKLIKAVAEMRDGSAALRDAARRDKDAFGAAIHAAQAEAFGTCWTMLQRLEAEGRG
jgi:hypothetical protein